jgi:hypothetical protein
MRVMDLGADGVIVKPFWGKAVLIPYRDILTAERPRRPRRRLRLHLCRAESVVVSYRDGRPTLESELRVHGVRIVDCWGAILAPTLLDFEDELAREPTLMRQSSDSG